jgi:hypothetical protein
MVLLIVMADNHSLVFEERGLSAITINKTITSDLKDQRVIVSHHYQ